MNGAWWILIVAGVWFVVSVVIFTVLDAKMNREIATLAPYEISFNSGTATALAMFWPIVLIGSPLWGLGKLIAWVTRKIISALDSPGMTK